MSHSTAARRACVVVPAFNEAGGVADVVRALLRHFEVVLVIDDGSRDATGRLARSAGATVLRHPVNLGQGAALQTGIQYAAGLAGIDHVLTFDADGQHDVDDAVAAVEAAAASGVDLVLGSRFLQAASSNVPTLRRLTLRAGLAFTRATTGLELTDTHNGLRVLSRRAAAETRLRQHGMAHASEILELAAREGWSYLEVPARVRYSEQSMAKGQSSLNALNIVCDLALGRLRGRVAC